MKRFAIFTILLSFALTIKTQDLNEDFLDSLPENIRDDILSSAQKDGTSNFEYDSPETRIKKLETSLEEAERNLASIRYEIEKSEPKKGLERFGDSFFQSIQSSFIPINEPNLDPSYILDFGDLLKIQIVGKENETHELLVNRDGLIAVPDVGTIMVQGLSSSDAFDKIIDKISAALLGVDVSVSIIKPRAINVLIVGSAEKPGMYTLNGGSTVLSLIHAAGGIQKDGSYRNISHKRSGKAIAQIDLYDVLVEGDMTSLSQLRSGDVLVIEPLISKIAISGSAIREGIYELLPDETLEDLLRISGFRNSNTSNNITIERFKNENHQILKIDTTLSDSFALLDGDSVRIDSVLPEFEVIKTVTITGAVNIPGTYSFSNNMTISEIIEKAGGYTEEAFPLGGVLLRKSVMDAERSMKEKSYEELLKYVIGTQTVNANPYSSGGFSKEVVTLLSLLKDFEPSGRLIAEFELSSLKKDSTKDILLQNGDQIHIPQFLSQVLIFGEVINPIGLQYSSDLRVNDVINAAGGFSRIADEDKIIIVSPNGKAMKYTKGFLQTHFGEEPELVPGSIVYVPRYIGKVDGINLAATLAPVVSSIAISLASLNSINN